MSTIKPTDEQDLAARAVVLFMRDMPGFPVAHHTYLALTLAEREAALREQVATLTAELERRTAERLTVVFAPKYFDGESERLIDGICEAFTDEARAFARFTSILDNDKRSATLSHGVAVQRAKADTLGGAPVVVVQPAGNSVLGDGVIVVHHPNGDGTSGLYLSDPSAPAMTDKKGGGA